MKKLIFAFLAALVLTGCTTAENPAEDGAVRDSGADYVYVGNPVFFDLDSIPKEAEYFTVCRHRESGEMILKSDASLAEYPFSELDNYCYYIPRGNEPEIVESAEEGDAFVVDDKGLRLVVFDGDDYDLPFEEYKNRGKYDVFFEIIRNGAGGGISGVIESAVDSDGGRYRQVFYSTDERKILWESEYDLG